VVKGRGKLCAKHKVVPILSVLRHGKMVERHGAGRQGGSDQMYTFFHSSL
jgi:hypothetical protein